jgi:polyisoprenoid-binding protein YceI
MRKTIGMALALAATLATGVAAQGTNVLRLTTGPDKKIWIEGSSTVRKFSCVTSSFEATPRPVPSPTAPLASAVQAVEVRIPVTSLSCGNGTMDEHMRKALKAEQNPEIRFELSGYTVGEKTAAGTEVKATGVMTIAGASKTVELTGVVTPTATGLRVQGEAPLRMTEYGVKPPSLMLGTLKVADAITVHYDVVLER